MIRHIKSRLEHKNGSTGLLRPHSGPIAFSVSGQNGLSSFYTIQEHNFCAKRQYANMARYDRILTPKKYFEEDGSLQ